MRLIWNLAKRYFYSIIGAAIIGSGWSWYHIAHRPHGRFYVITALLCGAVFVGFHVFKRIFSWTVRRLGRHRFWHQEFVGFLDELFFVFSLLFVIFWFRSEALSIGYVTAVLGVLYWRTQHYFSHHPGAAPWLNVNRAVFIFTLFLFLLQSILQYVAHYYYILDSNARFFNIVVFRSVAMTLFWLAGFAVASFLYWKLPRGVRFVAVGLWSALFVLILVVWVVNVATLYYSGLYFSPVVLEHASGGGDVIRNATIYLLVLLAALVLALFMACIRLIAKAHRQVPPRYWYYYITVIVLVAAASYLGLSSFKNTPERVMAEMFYEYYFGTPEVVELNPVIKKKLEKFGLFYNLDEFYVHARPTVFSPSATRQLLPERLLKNKPNVVIFFVESFSARLNSAYNPNYPDVTPNFARLSQDKNTTIFKKYYNASTPTITGTLAQFCSFLPPTGHEEIDSKGKFQNHHLLCLPNILKKHAGFKTTNYITAVEKEYAHKAGLFTSSGIDKIYGTEELKKYISGPPLAWGYSDHQMMPVLWRFMREARATGQEPFLMTLATVDTHPPFDLAKDAVPYGDGKNAVLNMYHTTDDAFGKFWDEFTKSDLYDNTIVIVVGDHPAFPSQFITKLFPDVAKDLTFYDETTFMMYVPDSVLPRVVEVYSSGLDFTPTLLQMLDINVPNSFEGHSIFDSRSAYPNLLGMHELGLYINQIGADGKRGVLYNVPARITCPTDYTPSSTPELTLCDYKQFYDWKRQAFAEGRFWQY